MYWCSLYWRQASQHLLLGGSSQSRWRSSNQPAPPSIRLQPQTVSNKLSKWCSSTWQWQTGSAVLCNACMLASLAWQSARLMSLGKSNGKSPHEQRARPGNTVCEKFQAKCKCKSQPKYLKMQNLNPTKNLKYQAEIREKGARCHGNHRRLCMAAAHSCSMHAHMRRTAQEVIKYGYFYNSPSKKNCLNVDNYKIGRFRHLSKFGPKCEKFKKNAILHPKCEKFKKGDFTPKL